MQYVFAFLLISCLSGGILTYILTCALFFRRRSTEEMLFLGFLTCLTLRMIVDTVIFYVLPHFTSTGGALYALLLVGRIVIPCSFLCISLFMHRLTGIFQSQRSLIAVSLTGAALILFFTLEFVFTRLRRPPTMEELYVFSPVDFIYYLLIAYPITVFFVFRKRVKNLTLQRLIRDFIVMILCALPFMLFEDFFGTFNVIFEFMSDKSLPLKLFPVYYLLIYLFLLFAGFRHLSDRRPAGTGAHAVSDEFVRRYSITAREREILLLMMEGASNKRIGEKLFISAATVRNHLHNIFTKTRVANRVELLRLASS